MADRVYPAAKPIPLPPQAINGGGSAANGGAPTFPAAKGQIYAPTRYRPQPPSRRSRRRSCRCCCLWFALAVAAAAILIAVAGAVFYLVYRPHRPSFSVTSVRLAAFNVSGASNALLTSRIDISVTARNPNRKIQFLYDETSIAASSSGADVGDGSFPAFVHGARNTTVLRATLSRSGGSLDAAAASDLRKRSALPLEIELETRAGMKIGSLKTKKLRFRATCSGVSVAVPKGKSAATVAVIPSGASCKVSMRIKIWKWTI